MEKILQEVVSHPQVHSSDDVEKAQKIVVQTKSAVNQACDIEILMRWSEAVCWNKFQLLPNDWFLHHN